MVELRHLPPSRAGQLWLASRLRAGRLAADLLNRKLAILRLEQERLRLLADSADARWRANWREADAWILRATVLSGQREVHLSAAATPAEITISWTSVMGVRYPVGAACHMPEASVGDRGPGSAALVEATASYRGAVEAAAAHAVADTARRVIDGEVATTRRRVRAIKDRWVPRLEAALRDLTRELDETERAETFRLRWVSGSGPAISTVD